MPVPIPSALKARLPAFGTVSDALIQIVLNEAAGWVGSHWAEPDNTAAHIYVAAHLLTLEGHKPAPAGMAGTFAEARTAGVKQLTSGPLSVTFAGGAEAGAGDLGTDAWWGKTDYGLMYLAIRARWPNSPMIV